MDEQTHTKRLQVVAHMTSLLDALRMNAAKMEKAYGVSRRHIEKFKLDQWSLTSRDELQILMTLAKDYGFDFLTLEIDEVWRTFGEEPAATFVSRKGNGQRPEDERAQNLLLDEGIKLGHPEIEGILEKMKTQNVVLIGSPKHNVPCEIALRTLAGDKGEPGVSTTLPFEFVWRDWQDLGKHSRFCSQSGPDNKVGVRILVKDTGTRNRAVAKHRRREVFLKADPAKNGGEYGWDFGVFAMCRKPFGTAHDVTTIMFGGVTGFATQEIARELSRGLLFLNPKKIQDGQPLWRVLCCPWKREGRRVVPHSDGRKWLDPDDIRALRAAERSAHKPPPRRGAEPGSEEDLR